MKFLHFDSRKTCKLAVSLYDSKGQHLMQQYSRSPVACLVLDLSTFFAVSIQMYWPRALTGTHYASAAYQKGKDLPSSHQSQSWRNIGF
jgi:hypothetical protein